MGSSIRNVAGHELDRLILEARGGCTVALNQLLEALSWTLWTELGGGQKPRGLEPAHGLSDLIQDTLARVREKFGRFERNSYADFRQWALTILYRRRQEWSRNHRTRNDVARKEDIGRYLLAVLNPNGLTPPQEHAAQLREESDRMYAAFERLETGEQVIIRLRAVESLQFPQIGVLTNRTSEAIRKAYDRAMEKLRGMLNANGDL
jgi:RNA polymerase sigma factor (sigma-70 family)